MLQCTRVIELARQARSKSESGIYHVMLRGNERKPVFLDEEDKNRYVEIMLQKKEAAGSHLYAYCIMDNHVHMVIRELENGQPLETLMKRIGVTYALYFNKKYKRVGHVFQDRFRSEVIEDESYLLSVIRYVHRNPVKSEMVQELNYSWSSYHWYIGFKKNLPLLPEMEDVLGQFSQDRRTAVKGFTEFHQEEETRTFLDVSEDSGNGESAQDILEKFLQRHSWTKEDLNRSENRAIAAELIETLVRKSGISGREVAEITGINREKVRRIFVSREPSL
jgi:putative transposase